MNTQRFSALGALLITSLISCSESPPTFHADTNPSRLSDWGLFDLSDESLTPTHSTWCTGRRISFSQTTHKSCAPSGYRKARRHSWLAMNSAIRLARLSAKLYYPTDDAGNLQRMEEVISESIDLSANQLIETRLLVKRSAGWEAFPYVWNDEGSKPSCG